MQLTSPLPLVAGLGLMFLNLAPCPALAVVKAAGHRGNSLFAPENTLASFQSALSRADYIELDGQPCADGTLVVMHDSTVDRTTDGTGSVASMTVAQLKTLDAGSWFSAGFTGTRVPTLEEALTNIIPAAIPLIERKSGTPEDYVNLLRKIHGLTNVVLQSFDWNFLASVHALEPLIPLCALGSGTFTSSSLISITNSGARRVAWEKTGVTASMVRMVQSQGVEVIVWTVDGPEIKNYIDLGVDAIISNDPGMVRQLQQGVTNATGNLGDRLMTYWKMDDGLTNPMATAVLDSKGTNSTFLTRNDGISHWLGSGGSMFDGAVQLGGLAAWINMPRADIGTNEVTISAWIKLRELPSQMATSYGAILDSTNDCYILYLDKASKELRFKVTDTAAHAARPGIPEALLQTNQWIHVAGTYTGQAGPASGQACIYLNGQPQDVHTGNDNTSPAGLTGTVKPGQYAAMGREGPSGANYFYGQIDDMAFWRRALTPPEIRAIHEGGRTGLSLGDQLRKPTALILPKSASYSGTNGTVVLDFQSQGSWTTFRLLRARSLKGPFLGVPAISPVYLGRGLYRFTCPVDGEGLLFFRIEGQ